MSSFRQPASNAHSRRPLHTLCGPCKLKYWPLKASVFLDSHPQLQTALAGLVLENYSYRKVTFLTRLESNLILTIATLSVFSFSLRGKKERKKKHAE